MSEFYLDFGVVLMWLTGLVVLIAAMAVASAWYESNHWLLDKLRFLPGIIGFAVLILFGWMGQAGYSFYPYMPTFEGNKVLEYVQSTTKVDPVKSSFWGNEKPGDLSKDCLYDEKCRGFVVRSSYTEYWFKIDPQTGERYYVQSSTQERVAEDEVREASADKIVSELKSQTRLENPALARPYDTKVFWADMDDPSQGNVIAHGVFNGQRVEVSVAVSKDGKIRVVPDASSGLQEKDFMK